MDEPWTRRLCDVVTGAAAVGVVVGLALGEWRGTSGLAVTEGRLVGGYLYPLDVRAALDPARSRQYVAACVRRALREPKSARNSSRERTLAAIARASRRSLDEPPTRASKRARELLRSDIHATARAP